MKRETRFIPGLELRATKGEDGKRTIAGHAAVFDKDSVDFGGWVERIAKGAFRESLAQKDVRALWSHNIDFVLGRTGNRSLKLWEDDYGLAFELELPDTSLGRDAFTSIERGDVSGMSFGFEFPKREDVQWTRGENGKPHLRTLLKVSLFEISPTAFPAYEQTDVATRDARAVLEEIEKEWEQKEGIWQRQADVEAWRPRI